VQPLFDKISLLCIKRLKSHTSISSSSLGNLDNRSESFVATVSKDLPMAQDIQPFCEVGMSSLTQSTNPIMPSISLFSNTALANSPTDTYQEQLITHQPQGGLLAMMGTPLNQFSDSPALSVPIYGDFGTEEESEYFSYFNAT
jgi:hypothetical protein